MKTVELDGRKYELTHRTGMPAIRKLNKNGETAQWISLGSDLGKSVMRAADMEPGMAPGMSKPS